MKAKVDDEVEVGVGAVFVVVVTVAVSRVSSIEILEKVPVQVNSI